MANIVIALGDSALPEAVPLLVQLLEPKKVNIHNNDVKDRDMLNHMIVHSLGKLQYPDAFQALERFAQRKSPVVWVEMIDALIACGEAQAIPFLHQVWEFNVENQRYIIQALLWMETNATADKIKDGLVPNLEERRREMHENKKRKTHTLLRDVTCGSQSTTYLRSVLRILQYTYIHVRDSILVQNGMSQVEIPQLKVELHEQNLRN